MNAPNHAHDIFLDGLRNAHAMEKQAPSLMQPQVNCRTNYPDLSQRLQSHIAETEGQIVRLDQILERHRESSSAIKDTFLSTAGSMAAMGHATAKLCGENDAIQVLELGLDEERRMANGLRKTFHR